MTTPNDDPNLDPDFQPDNIALEAPSPEEVERLESISVHPDLQDEPSDAPTDDPERPSNPA